jgi:hypothetical protein
MAIECPNCKLANPDTAERCDCGYVFSQPSTPGGRLAALISGRPPRGASDANYQNIIGASSALRSYALVLRLFAGVGLITAAVAALSSSGSVFVAVVALCVALGLATMATVVAAVGEALLALREIAINSRR